MTSIIETEAERMYPPLTYDGTHGTLRPAFTTDDLQEAYMRGATRTWTDGEVDAAASILWDDLRGDCDDWDAPDWGELSDMSKWGLVRQVRALLKAAAKVADGEDAAPTGGNRAVHLPPIVTFGHMTPDKWLLLKTLEEAAELVEAGKRWVKATDDAAKAKAWADMVTEWADVAQTLANTAAAFGITDGQIRDAMAACLERNRRKGRI